MQQDSGRPRISSTGPLFSFKQNFYIKLYEPRKPQKDPSNQRLYEHGICNMYQTLPGLELSSAVLIPLGHSDGL